MKTTQIGDINMTDVNDMNKAEEPKVVVDGKDVLVSDLNEEQLVMYNFYRQWSAESHKEKADLLKTQLATESLSTKLVDSIRELQLATNSNTNTTNLTPEVNEPNEVPSDVPSEVPSTV